MEENNEKEIENEKKNKKIIILDILGIIIFVSTYFFKDYPYINIIMCIVSYILIGLPIFTKALKHLFKKDMFDENLLMSIATIGALCIGEYIEGIIVILLYKIGEFLQDMAVDKSKEKIKNAIDIRADYANLVIGNDVKKVDPTYLKISDIIVVKNGEKIPVDGIVIKGSANIDTSSLTGESKPIKVEKNDEVLSGMINLDNIIEIKVTKTFENSTASKITLLIENARKSKSKTEKFITKFSKVYTPIVISIAILIAIIFPLAFNISISEAINRALIFLVVSCPCALVISVPLGFFVGMGACSKKGILVKGSNYLDILSKVDTIAFDKTGTLTKGSFKITKVNNKSDIEDDKIIEYIALCEIFSNHYIAKSIVNCYNKKLDKNRVKQYKEMAGYGITAKVDDNDVVVGNIKLIKMKKIKVEEENIEYGTVVYLAINGKYIGNIVLSDQLKNNVENLTTMLKRKSNIKNNVLVTGDKENIAKIIADKLKFDEVYYELLPQDKVEVIQNLKKNTKNKLAFVGDGINDSPVLTSADVGISMGKGSDLAINSSDIVLMTDEPYKLLECLKIAKKTKRIVLQNIVLALSFKILVLIISAFGISNMWEAIFADVGISLLAILNSIRIFKM